MTILLTCAVIVGIFLIFAIITKILKFIFISIALLITLAIVGYLFLTGDGSMTEAYLPEAQQEQINAIRNNTNAAIQNKAQEATDAMKNSALDMTDAAVEKLEHTLEEGIDKSKKQLQNDKSSTDAANKKEEKQ